jgi:hypothetical protein
LTISGEGSVAVDRIARMQASHDVGFAVAVARSSA